MKHILILVVDDEPAVRDVIAETLHDEGYQVSSATDGQEALTVMENIRPDLVILDIDMPRIDGYGFIAAYREREPDGPPILAMSANMSPAAKERLAALNVHDCLSKPFDLNELIDCVKKFAGTPQRLTFLQVDGAASAN